MPLTIQVKSEQDDPPKLVFDLPRVVIGRSSGSDVRLPDTSVSLRHATIRQRGADYIVLDEGSTNGTFVGPVQLSPGAPRVVKNGDRVRVGRVWLEVGIDTGATPTGPHATRELALRLVAGALEADGSPGAPSLKVEQGPDTGLTLPLNEFQRVYTIGRNADCDLVLKDEDLSRRHFQLRRVGADVLVKDCTSKNGCSLDEHSLERERAWGPGQRLRAGQSVFTLNDPVQDILARIDAASDERVEGEIEEPPRDVAKPERAGRKSRSRKTSTTSDEDWPAEPGDPDAADDFAEPSQSKSRRGARARGNDAPNAEDGTSEPPKRDGTAAHRPNPGRSTWSAIDLLVALVSLIVLGASIAGFLWLLRG